MASKLMDLVYWRNMRRTGVVFTGLVIGLASLFQLSAITVLSHVCLGAMCVTFPLRLYYKLLEVLGWNPGVHPFQSYVGNDSSLTDKETVMLVEEVVLLMAFGITEIKRLIFIDSIFDSIKFIVLLYLLTYVGALTTGLTLVITGKFLFLTSMLIIIFKIDLREKSHVCVSFLNQGFLSLYESVKRTPVHEPPTKPAPAAAPARQKAKSK
uniref:Reticulon n=1 Tax=Mola mola TaxID=94237 RepID=A0A3Q3WU28_MOLML